MLTDNPVLVEKLRPLPALMCVQRKAQKKVVTEEDAIRSNIDSFGDDIGKTTNWITSMFDVQAKFEKGSREYDVLDYRIKCGQLFQQNAIDKAKGIISKPMPRSWHDRRAASMIDDPDTRSFYLSIVADKKPYFMRYIYPALKKQYNTYIKNTNKNSMREFHMTMEELLSLPQEKLTPRQREFIHYYHSKMPISNSGCVMNRICRKFEEAFDGYLSKSKPHDRFDYEIMKSGEEYGRSQFAAISRIYENYNKKLKNFAVFASYERVDEYDSYTAMQEMRNEFLQECVLVCPNASTLCDIVLDICYQRKSTKRFAWELCGHEIIQNLLRRRGGVISYPTLDEDGEITFYGNHFSIRQENIGGIS